MTISPFGTILLALGFAIGLASEWSYAVVYFILLAIYERVMG